MGGLAERDAACRIRTMACMPRQAHAGLLGRLYGHPGSWLAVCKSPLAPHELRPLAAPASRTAGRDAPGAAPVLPGQLAAAAAGAAARATGNARRGQGPPRVRPRIRPSRGLRSAHPDRPSAPPLALWVAQRSGPAWPRKPARTVHRTGGGRGARYRTICPGRGLTDAPIGPLRSRLPPSASPRGRPGGPRGRACHAAAAVRGAVGRLERRGHASYPAGLFAIDVAAAAARLERRSRAGRGR